MESHAMRSMTTPNAHTITEHTANKNRMLADEYELAAEVLRRIQNKAFEDAILGGVDSLVESCKRRRKNKMSK